MANKNPRQIRKKVRITGIVFIREGEKDLIRVPETKVRSKNAWQAALFPELSRGLTEFSRGATKVKFEKFNLKFEKFGQSQSNDIALYGMPNDETVKFADWS